ncbi:hypothetical protein [Xanthocytophaga agilis]|uniref:Uncharacterized protein n=1 Tax=Xanthocytophaga agilis TaxID=3048010 RepID=A0AAE3R457_9BACT|nr:hypothetical protein [Xanthocytophaga agilis]MDJ1501214.1 hypothetical protein [Xanthocytophaga agilis]
MIKLQDLKGFTINKIKDLLWDQRNILWTRDSKTFFISIPKTTQWPIHSKAEIASDYLNLAFCGQEIWEIAKDNGDDFESDFQYQPVPIEEDGSVLFTVSFKNTEWAMSELADAICLLAFLYRYTDDTGFHDNIDWSEYENNLDLLRLDMIKGFKEDMEWHEFYPACPYFLEVYHNFSKE